MSLPEILVTIDEDGVATIEVINGDGVTCEAATKELEDALGVVTNRELKPEHSRRKPTTAVVNRRLNQR